MLKIFFYTEVNGFVIEVTLISLPTPFRDRCFFDSTIVIAFHSSILIELDVFRKNVDQPDSVKLDSKAGILLRLNADIR
jgi:hypothetical protein